MEFPKLIQRVTNEISGFYIFYLISSSMDSDMQYNMTKMHLPKENIHIDTKKKTGLRKQPVLQRTVSTNIKNSVHIHSDNF